MPWIPKPGVSLATLRPELARLEPICAMLWEEFGIKCVVTSANKDGYDSRGRPIHLPWSFHYKDAAVDLRIHQLGEKLQLTLYAALCRQINLQWPGLYDILLEKRGEVGAHIHLEPSKILAAQLFPEGPHGTTGGAVPA